MALFSILFFSVLFSISYILKGGQGDDIFRNWNKVRSRSKILERFLDGKVISSILVLIGVSFYTVFAHVNLGIMPQAWQSNLLIVALWLLAIAPSMGEEYGSIIGKPYGAGFDRSYGIKKGIQRGVWIGACMATATGFLWFIPASLLFVPLAWIALNHIKARFLFLDPWGWSEFLIGLFIFGIPMAFHAIGIQPAL